MSVNQPDKQTRLRWKLGDFVGRWISARLGAWIEGESW